MDSPHATAEPSSPPITPYPAREAVAQLEAHLTHPETKERTIPGTEALAAINDALGEWKQTERTLWKFTRLQPLGRSNRRNSIPGRGLAVALVVLMGLATHLRLAVRFTEASLRRTVRC